MIKKPIKHLINIGDVLLLFEDDGTIEVKDSNILHVRVTIREQCTAFVGYIFSLMNPLLGVVVYKV